jgi:hypothetical protein
VAELSAGLSSVARAKQGKVAFKQLDRRRIMSLFKLHGHLTVPFWTDGTRFYIMDDYDTLCRINWQAGYALDMCFAQNRCEIGG